MRACQGGDEDGCHAADDLAKADEWLQTVLGATTDDLTYSPGGNGLSPVQQLLCAAIAGHHPPVTLDQPLALLVHGADALACAMACAEDGTSEIPPLDPHARRGGQRQHRNPPRRRHQIRVVEHRRSAGQGVREFHLRDAPCARRN